MRLLSTSVITETLQRARDSSLRRKIGHTGRAFRWVSEEMAVGLPYDDLVQLKKRMWEVCPGLVRYDALEAAHPPASQPPRPILS
ncbi:hypothetical protein PCANC_00451 [Puccinia coronata f. sp. avenae]|uniref:Uncharacterized protein n=1 Tax=Puccinia coronata f. sp. avenae TaxID=200324 RepID=A0A2N5W8A3_9BASI|nr:hypothetical protein PCANC_00451 [Puccinia coronata f. sp. avenae]